MIPSQKLMEDDFDRTYFCKQKMAILDKNVIQLEHVLFFDECTFTLQEKPSLYNRRRDEMS